MFKMKYTVSLLDSQWKPIERNIKLVFIPRRGEFIYWGDKYYEVLNVVHTFNNKQDIFIVMNELQSEKHK